MLSLTFAPPAKFVRRYADIGASITRAVEEYKQDVESRSFPTEDESYHLPAGVQL
jgi:3-methyl-2-oxobutanoate hydroxymethyltransferase